VTLSDAPSTLAWEASVELLKDRAATREEIGAIHTIAEQTRAHDAVVIFYAGHSMALGDRFYLLPTDAKVPSACAPSGAICDLDLEAALDGVDAAHIVFILDSCNSGKIMDARDRRGLLNSRGLARLTYDKAMWALTASQSLEEGREEMGVGHGLLTYALMEEEIMRWEADPAGSGSSELGAWPPIRSKPCCSVGP
jgi:uncharacterized caspase-like protein